MLFRAASVLSGASSALCTMRSQESKAPRCQGARGVMGLQFRQGLNTTGAGRKVGGLVNFLTRCPLTLHLVHTQYAFEPKSGCPQLRKE